MTSSLPRDEVIPRVMVRPVAEHPAIARVAVTLFLALSITNVIWALNDWRLYDLAVYLQAGEAWIESGNPYSITPETTPMTVYRYAPWFAAIFVPLSMLPDVIVRVAYSVVVTVASVLAVVPVLREYGRAAIPVAAFFGTLLFAIGTGGNIQPVIVAMLVWTLNSRAGPLAIAIAASLKATPILFVLVFIGRREWGKAAWTLALSVVLIAPMLLFERADLTMSFGQSYSLWHVHPVLWAAVAAVSVIGALWYAQTHHGWLAAAVAVLMASPRLIGYDLTILLAAAPRAASQPTEGGEANR